MRAVLPIWAGSVRSGGLMKTTKRISLVAALACVALLGAALFSGVAQAKKLKPFNGAKTVNAPIPNKVVNGFDGVLRSIIPVPKKFKGKTVSDVKVTFQTTGSAANAANDLDFVLTSPGGRTIDLVAGLPGQSIGPLTLSPNSSVRICGAVPPNFCATPQNSLYAPFFGTARDIGLSDLTGVNMKGNWTLTVFDQSGPATTSVLNQWKLNIVPQKPIA
jgi:hypothetical protein